MLAYQVSMLPRLKGTAVYTWTLAYFCRRWGEGPTPRHRHLTGATVRQTEKDNMLSTQQKFSIGYFILALLGLVLIQTVFFAPQSENLSYRDFKTLLKAGKVVDLLLHERTMTGRLSTEGLEGLLPAEKIAELRKSGRGEPRFVTVKVDDPTLIPDLEAAGVQFQGRIESQLARHTPVLDYPGAGVRGHLGIPHAAYGPGQWAHEHRQEQGQGLHGKGDGRDL